jgi:hypothetical protein
MQLDLKRVRDNARQATSEDLLDRLTVYAPEMEPAALEIIEEELRGRGIGTAEILSHAEEREKEVLRREDGSCRTCSFCERPAVAEGLGWHRLWGRIPVFLRYFYYCAEHKPATGAEEETAEQ